MGKRNRDKPAREVTAVTALQQSDVDRLMGVTMFSNGDEIRHFRRTGAVLHIRTKENEVEVEDPNVSVLCRARAKTKDEALWKLFRLRAILRYELNLPVRSLEKNYGHYRKLAPSARPGLEADLSSALEAYRDG